MSECSFCKKQYDVPKGLTFVLENGDVLYFCSSKCHKNWKMGRVGKKMKWIKKEKKMKEKKVDVKEKIEKKEVVKEKTDSEVKKGYVK